MEEYREEVRGVYVGQDTDAGAGSGTGEAAGKGVQQDISLEKERTRVEVVKATQIIDTLKDSTSLRYLTVQYTAQSASQHHNHLHPPSFRFLLHLDLRSSSIT